MGLAKKLKFRVAFNPRLLSPKQINLLIFQTPPAVSRMVAPLAGQTWLLALNCLLLAPSHVNTDYGIVYQVIQAKTLSTMVY